MEHISDSREAAACGLHRYQFVTSSGARFPREDRAIGAAPSSHEEHCQPLRTALELRFQVYCIECNFLSPADYPDGVESDEYDECAAHFYAFDPDDALVGYVRLVQPGPGRLFPFQNHCEVSAIGPALPSPYQAAEISRLMVRRDYRRRRSDQLSGVTAEQNVAAFAGDRRHHASQVLLNLYRQMYQHSLANGIQYWYAAMERPLARSLARLSFAFEAIGPSTDYFGPVAPYLLDLSNLGATVGKRDPALWAWLQEPAIASAEFVRSPTKSTSRRT